MSKQANLHRKELPAMPKLKMRQADILDYLDTAICTWTAIRNNYNRDPLAKTPKDILDSTVAEFYISAYQNVRVALFGEHLSDKDMTKNVTEETINCKGYNGTYWHEGDYLFIKGHNGSVIRYKHATSKRPATKQKKGQP